jgi:hypothetical protein
MPEFRSGGVLVTQAILRGIEPGEFGGIGDGIVVNDAAMIADHHVQRKSGAVFSFNEVGMTAAAKAAGGFDDRKGEIGVHKIIFC